MRIGSLVLLSVLTLLATGWTQSPPAAPPDAAVHVVTYLDLLPSQADPGRVLLTQQIQAERTWQGCLSAALLQEQGRANHFMVVESWRDVATLEEWHASGAYRQFRTSLQPALGSPLDERRASALVPLTILSR